LAQSYVAVEVVAKSVASNQQTGAIEPSDAQRIKAQLQEAKNLLDVAAQAPIGSDARANAITQAQALLSLARQYLVNHGGAK